ncbi:aminotransferase class I/II-fold pyridoxal phosphate-dependent enzyme [Paenibacillus sp. GCM10023252]|uniref:aminotransferase class I/II-fold pyridoxal phosphate-dependent enzyme n=1 Tax=Paenibacillus sp. GCM10023252 TaxID=3252649 RepID=UPI00360C48F5
MAQVTKTPGHKEWRSSRLAELGSPIFAEVAEWKQEAIASGLDVIDLGIGSPDQPPSPEVRQALSEAALRTDKYAYPGSRGSSAFRQTAAEWMAFRFGVQVDPELEMLSLMGSQDGLAHLAMAICNPGDVALIPDPGYPIYAASLALAGVEPYLLPLTEGNGYLPDLAAVPDSVWQRAKFLLLNYPSNPLSATADLPFFQSAVNLAREHGVLIVSDLAYSEMSFDGYEPPSILSVPGAVDTAVEFHSLSKSFNMAGCRIGFLAGNRAAIASLRELKASIDFGVFNAVQDAGVVALKEAMSSTERPKVGRLYEERRNIFVEALRAEGWNVPLPKATMFIWAPLPPLQSKESRSWSSRQIARAILAATGVVVIPGSAFGALGEGYVRIAMVEEAERLVEAAKRIGRWMRALH